MKMNAKKKHEPMTVSKFGNYSGYQVPHLEDGYDLIIEGISLISNTNVCVVAINVLVNLMWVAYFVRF